jgi:hypothetical protein
MENVKKMENLLIYGSIFDLLEDMTNEEAGLLFKGLNDFRNGKEVSFEDRYLQGLWKGILPNLNKLVDNYDSKVARNRENGKKGGRPSTKEISTETTVKAVESSTKVEIINTDNQDRIEIHSHLVNKFKMTIDEAFEFMDIVIEEFDSSVFNQEEIKLVDKFITKTLKAA